MDANPENGTTEWQDAGGKKPKDTRVLFYDREKTVPDPETGGVKSVLKPYCRKITPGTTNLVYDQPVKEEDKRQYSEEWERYLNKEEQKYDGTLLEQWGVLTEKQCNELKSMNVFTVEDIANMSDAAAHKLMGFHGMRDKARQFVKEKPDEKINSLEAQNAELMKRLEALEAQQNKEPSEREKLETLYKEKFGEKPHHKMKDETILAKLNSDPEEASTEAA